MTKTQTEQTRDLIVYDVPVECHVSIDPETGRVARVAFLPCEADAGYFGPGITAIEQDGASDEEVEEGLGKLRNDNWEALEDLDPLGRIEWVV